MTSYGLEQSVQVQSHHQSESDQLIGIGARDETASKIKMPGNIRTCSLYFPGFENRAVPLLHLALHFLFEGQ